MWNLMLVNMQLSVESQRLIVVAGCLQHPSLLGLHGAQLAGAKNPFFDL
jgi:hypothetical protein